MHVGHQSTTNRLLLKDAIKRSYPRRNNSSSPGRLGGPRQGHALAWDHVACLLRYDIRVPTRIGITHRHVRLLLDPKRCAFLYELLFGRLQLHLLPLHRSFNNGRTGQWVSHRRGFRNRRHLSLDLHWKRGSRRRLQGLAIPLRISEWSTEWSIRWRHGLRDRDRLAEWLRSSLCRRRNCGYGSLAEWRLHHGSSLRLCSNWDIEAASHGLRNCWRFNLGR